MNREAKKVTSEESAASTEEGIERIQVRQPRYLLVAWILLLLIGALFLFAPLSDFLADVRTGLPSDHLEAFRAVTGIAWASAQQSSPQITRYITLLEIAYAAHELVFALLFLVIVAIPFRKRARWSWWACWIPMIANLVYTFTFGSYSSTTLIYSLITDVALPVLLFIHAPAFFGKRKPRPARP